MSQKPIPKATSKPRSIAVGIDIGGTKVALLAEEIRPGDDNDKYNYKTAEIARRRFATPEGIDPGGIIELLRDEIAAMLTEAGRDMSEIAAVGAAVPGLVDENGHLLAAGNLGWSDFPFRARLAEILGVPAFVEHDANAAALGERWIGHARDLHSFVFLALGTGIGAGLFLDGRLYRGAHHAAGELGDLIPGRGGLGKTPIKARPLSEFIGSGAIREIARDASGEDLDAASFIRAGQSGENSELKPLAEKVVDYIAIAVISLITVVDPEAIIFGGGTSSAGDELIERVRDRVRNRVHEIPKLLRSALGEDAQLHGAIYGALTQI